jgi:hypothetical protein
MRGSARSENGTASAFCFPETEQAEVRTTGVKGYRFAGDHIKPT